MLTPAGSGHMKVTKNAAKKVLYAQIFKRAPGPDKIVIWSHFPALEMGWKEDKRPGNSDNSHGMAFSSVVATQ